MAGLQYIAACTTKGTQVKKFNPLLKFDSGNDNMESR